MIFNTKPDFSVMKQDSTKNAIENLKKAQAILDERYEKKLVSNEEYIRRSNELKEQLDKYSGLLSEDYY